MPKALPLDGDSQSQAMDINHASIVVVGEDGANIQGMKEQLRRKIRFSA